MSFEVYDYRTTDKNVLVTPEIRARLYHMKPGQVDGRHSHDLGHEVFLILEGKAEFNIKGTKKVLGPGEMCVALVDEIHQVRNVLEDQPTIMYLSVTPHIQPTHTGRTDDDAPMPPRFRANSGYDDTTEARSQDELLDQHLSAMQALANAAQTTLETQRAQAAALRMAWTNGDDAAATEARDAMWYAIRTLHKEMVELGKAWNALAPEAAPNE